MAAGPSWAVLPSVLVVEILSYLSLTDRLRVSLVCKRWRSCLFQPSLWPRLVFNLKQEDREKTKFLANVCGRFLRETVVRFNSHEPAEVRECFRILAIFTENKNIQSFTLQPSSCHIEWPEQISCERFAKTVAEIIKTSRKLQHFSLGCAEELLEHSGYFLDLLSRHHSVSLQGLHFASIKEDCEDYGIIELNAAKFQRFSSLKNISLDYDFVDNSLLEVLSSGTCTRLEQLCLHIHGIEPEHEKIRNETWRRVCSYHTSLEVTLNIAHSYVGVEGLLDILQPKLPLAHFRQFFCSHVNTAAITYMATHYGDTLKSVHIIDSYCEGLPCIYSYQTDEDPFVMLAWRCPHLERFTLIGYDVADRDIIAIARLRGKNLKEFCIPEGCLSVLDDDDDLISLGYVGPEFATTVSESLGRPWSPMTDNIPRAVFSDEADAELAYMPMLLSDQEAK